MSRMPREELGKNTQLDWWVVNIILIILGSIGDLGVFGKFGNGQTSVIDSEAVQRPWRVGVFPQSLSAEGMKDLMPPDPFLENSQFISMMLRTRMVMMKIVMMTREAVMLMMKMKRQERQTGGRFISMRLMTVMVML